MPGNGLDLLRGAVAAGHGQRRPVGGVGLHLQAGQARSGLDGASLNVVLVRGLVLHTCTTAVLSTAFLRICLCSVSLRQLGHVARMLSTRHPNEARAGLQAAAGAGARPTALCSTYIQAHCSASSAQLAAPAHVGSKLLIGTLLPLFLFLT
jgi:hypothetical protein